MTMDNGGDWVFTLIAPCVDPMDDDDDSTENDEQRRRTMVQLRGGGSSNNDESGEPSSFSDQDDDSFLDSREYVSLLVRSSTTTHHKSNEWTFSGPNQWSIGSRVLLKVTWCWAWQAMPTAPIGTARKILSCRSSKVCCRQEKQLKRDTYETRDVARVEQMGEVSVRGVGPCRAVRLHLRNKSSTSSMQECPTPRLQAALEQQWNLSHDDDENSTGFDHFSQDADSLPQCPWQHHEGDFQQQSYGPILTFAMPIQDSKGPPPLLWKVELPPNKHVAIETLTVLDGTLTCQRQEPSHVYINGYQSWSYAGSVAKGDPQPTSAMPNVFSHAFNNGGSAASTVVEDDNDGGEDGNEEETSWEDNHGHAGQQSVTARRYALTTSMTRRKKHSGYKSDFFTCISSDGASAYRESPSSRLLDEWGGPALVLGWLSQHHQLGVVTVSANLDKVSMHADCSTQLWKRGGCTDWAYAQLVAPHNYDEEPMVHYLHAVAGHNEAKPLQNGSLLTGWCSWYHYYEKISAANLKDNFKTLHGLRHMLPTNVAIVDDGYMTAWGDWDSLKEKAFPEGSGLDVVSKDIRDNGMRPGLWMAPFACDRFSQLAIKHPDWIIRNDQGVYANSSNCGKFFYGLDATNPNVRDYVYRCVKRAVQEWGFDVLKIDFLYSACLAGNGKYDLSVSRAEAMHMALQTIRAAAGPDTFLIGCGCPIGSGIGYVDGMRVSADTGPTWYPAFPFPWWDHGTLPALRSMIRNSMSRACMGHRWWHNDPDCLLFGKSTSLTDQEIASAASVVAMTCGMLLLSDDLTKLSRERLQILTKIYPMTGATAVVLDLHSSNDGLPCLLRLWCTDRYNLAPFDKEHATDSNKPKDHNAEATFFGRQASFSADKNMPQPNERKRNCVHVAKGLGTWTLLSLSNWLDKPAVVYAPSQAVHPPPETGWKEGEDDEVEPLNNNSSSSSVRRQPKSMYGYHVFAFWSSYYTWIPEGADVPNGHQQTLRKHLDPHATEIFHIKPVSLNMPQYVGSDLHFSCGYEVRSFQADISSVTVCLKNDWNRVGSIFLYIPRVEMDDVVVKVKGVAVTRKPGGWDVVANTPRLDKQSSPPAHCLGRIIRVWVVVHADRSQQDGEISVQF